MCTAVYFASCCEEAKYEAEEEHVYQHLLMQRAVGKKTDQYEDIMSYFCPESYSNKHAVCTWSGIQCVDGFITTFVLSSTLKHKWTLGIDFLPQSIQLLHLEDVFIDVPFECDVLPRALRQGFPGFGGHGHLVPKKKLPGPPTQGLH